MSSDLDLAFLLEARVALDEPLHVGQTPDGYRMIVGVRGGRFDGPRLSGEVLPQAGADWSPSRSPAREAVGWSTVFLRFSRGSIRERPAKFRGRRSAN